MTPTQEKRIAWLKRAFLEYHSIGSSHDYEIKHWECEKLEGLKTYSVIIETGMVGDEKTLASVFARNRKHFFVTARGKISWMEKRKRNVEKKGPYKWASGGYAHQICSTVNSY